jgi:hypothetical protein
MSAEIIHTTPSSGEYSEVHFGQHFTYRLWVKFIDNNQEEWIGCFPKQYDGGFNAVIADNENNSAFVVAGGKGFLVDLNNKVIILELDDYPSIESVIKTNNPEYYIAGMFYSAYILDSNCLIKTIEPDFTTDGIYFTGQKENKAVGNLAAAMNHYESNYDFELDLTTFQITLCKDNSPSFWKKLFGK